VFQCIPVIFEAGTIETLKPCKFVWRAHVDSLAAGLFLGALFFFNFWLGLTWNQRQLTDLRPYYISFSDDNCPKGTELAYALYKDGQALSFCAQVRPKVKL